MCNVLLPFSVYYIVMFLNLATTNSGEAFELLDNLIQALLFIIVLYIPALVFATFSIVYKRNFDLQFQQTARKQAWIALIVGGCSLLAAYGVDKRYELKSDLCPANVCYNVYLTFQHTASTKNIQRRLRVLRFMQNRVIRKRIGKCM